MSLCTHILIVIQQLLLLLNEHDGNRLKCDFNIIGGARVCVLCIIYLL